MLNCEDNPDLSIKRLYELLSHRTGLLNLQRSSYLDTDPLQETLLSEKSYSNCESGRCAAEM